MDVGLHLFRLVSDVLSVKRAMWHRTHQPLAHLCLDDVGSQVCVMVHEMKRGERGRDWGDEVKVELEFRQTRWQAACEK